MSSNSLDVREKSDIIITDPCYIAKNKDWGKVFDWEHYTIEAPEFSDYVWSRTGQGDGSWMISGLHEVLNRVETEKFIEGFEDSIQNFNPQTDSILKISEYIKKQDYLGRFSVDSGSFGIFYLTDVLSYNPNFLRDHGIWLYTIIPDFVGSIQVKFSNNNHFNILGLGNKTFCSI